MGHSSLALTSISNLCFPLHCNWLYTTLAILLSMLELLLLSFLTLPPDCEGRGYYLWLSTVCATVAALGGRCGKNCFQPGHWLWTSTGPALEVKLIQSFSLGSQRYRVSIPWGPSLICIKFWNYSYAVTILGFSCFVSHVLVTSWFILVNPDLLFTSV